MELSTKQERTKLSLELVKDFYHGDPVYRKIRTAIESCRPLYLYKAPNKAFTHDEMNIYLGFFEDLGFFLRQGVITVETIDHLVGAYLIEAFEYPDIRKYIDDLRREMQDPEAFREFEELAKRIENNPARKRQIEAARFACKR